MSLFKCKMCGGNISAEAGTAFGTCDSCGVTSTLPKANEEKLVNLFNRANHFRRLGEFDKALSVYENILNEDSTSAEAHWCVVLCRYGIEYVEDPKTYERVPTCHRTQFASILTDADYLAALENAFDSYTKGLYEAEAKKISDIQKSILAISSQEEPYDIFICYKETTDGGSRTKDSAIAQDIYYQLADDYKVFFAKITLEDKLGQEYEPYIFNALNSAKVMLVLGTKKEHFEAVWVKNEWSRFLALMKNDRSRLLIPCYRDMDAYDIPDELAHLQSLDMSKIGFVQDLVRGVKKVFDTVDKADSQNDSAGSTPVNIDSLIKRGYMFLEDGNWRQADEYFDRVLDINPEYASAYVGKLCAEIKRSKPEELATSEKQLSNYSTFKRAIEFADRQLRSELEKYDLESKKTSGRFELYKKMRGKIAAGQDATIGVTVHGTLVCAGDKEVFGYAEDPPWKGVATVSVSDKLFALYEKGHVNSTERSLTLPITAGWTDSTDIIDVAAGGYTFGTVTRSKCHAFGVKGNGTVVTTIKPSKDTNWTDEELHKISSWRNIVSVAAGAEHVVALDRNGRVFAAGSASGRKCETEDWRDVTAIAAGNYCTLGLKSDGTVLFCGAEVHRDNGDGSYTMHASVNSMLSKSDWNNIVAIDAGNTHYVGLKNDGTVIASGTSRFGKCDTAEWRNIVAIAAGANHTVGLKDDGTVVAVGKNNYGQCDVSEWLDIGILTTSASGEEIREKHLSEKKRLEDKEKRKKEEWDKKYKQMQEWAKQGLCQECGGTLGGFIIKKCKSCGVAVEFEDRIEGFFDRLEDSAADAIDRRDEAKEKSRTPIAVVETVHNSGYSTGQVIFARWILGKEYYLGKIKEFTGNKVKIGFFDGTTGKAAIDAIMSFEEGLKVLSMEGNWKNNGTWYRGTISKTEPLTMSYDDGDVEVVQYKQLRGKRK